MADLLFLKSRDSDSGQETDHFVNLHWTTQTKSYVARNIISIALDFRKESFARMMFTEGYVDTMRFVDVRDEEDKSALYRACDLEMVDIARYIWPRYVDPSFNPKDIKIMCDLARNRGYLEIVHLFESVLPVQSKISKDENTIDVGGV